MAQPDSMDKQETNVNSVAAAAAFREHRIDFMMGIADPFIVANNLYSKNIISRERLDLILTPTLQWNERKIILLDAVEASLQTQPSCFNVLVTTLKWDPVLGIIGSAMKETYTKGEATYRASDQTLVPTFKDAQSIEHQQPYEGELGEEHLLEVNTFLTPLDTPSLFYLGIALGLSHSTLKDMENSKTFRADMIAAWLCKKDWVEKEGVPTWRNLVKGLKKNRQNGIASTIEKAKHLL